MTTACYSGGWTVQPDLNISILTAAGNQEESESRAKMKSVSRACGSIWASTILATPDFLAHTNDRIDPSGVHYMELAQSVQHALHSVDRLLGNLVNDSICFSAKDDRWGLDYRARLGVPLSHFQRRWNELKGVPPVYGNPMLNRDSENNPDNPEFAKLQASWDKRNLEKDDILFGMSGSMRGRFGSGNPKDLHASLRRMVLRDIEHYARSLPGRDSFPSNSELSADCSEVVKNANVTVPWLMRVSESIAYRMRLMELADRYIFEIGLHHEGRSCNGIDMDNWDQTRRPVFGQYRDVHAMLLAADLFPEPVLRSQGRKFSKPPHYLAAVFCESGCNKDEVKLNIADLVECKSFSSTVQPAYILIT